MVSAIDELELKYLALVERIRGYPMPEVVRASILAQVEAIYRQERVPLARDAGLVPEGREPGRCSRKA